MLGSDGSLLVILGGQVQYEHQKERPLSPQNLGRSRRKSLLVYTDITRNYIAMLKLGDMDALRLVRSYGLMYCSYIYVQPALRSAR